MTLVRRTTKHTKAAFSKSVICASHGRNSTLQPIGELGGGGLNLIVCQLVDWMFCKKIETTITKIHNYMH
jgi:hypothetical protein